MSRNMRPYRIALYVCVGVTWMLGDSLGDALANPVLGYLLAISFFNACVCVALAFAASQGRERN